MHERVSAPQVEFILTDCVMVFQNHLKVLLFVLFGHVYVNILSMNCLFAVGICSVDCLFVARATAWR